MSRSKRVLFTFDSRNLESLERVVDSGQYQSKSDAVREGVKVLNALQSQAAQGYTELVVRNPKTGAERDLVFDPSIATLDTSAEDAKYIASDRSEQVRDKVDVNM